MEITSTVIVSVKKLKRIENWNVSSHGWMKIVMKKNRTVGKSEFYLLMDLGCIAVVAVTRAML